MPHRLLQHPRFRSLTANATKALLYLASQYKGNNNGDLSIVWKLARTQGWTSNGALQRAVRELKANGFVLITRQGGRNRCSLYALTWFAIDHCGGKHDEVPTNTAPDDWLKSGDSSEPQAVQCEPGAVQSGDADCVRASH